MKTQCKTCKHHNGDYYALHPYCVFNEAYMTNETIKCGDWTPVTNPEESYYFLNANPTEGIWVFSRQAVDPGSLGVEVDKVKQYHGPDEYDVYIKTYHTHEGMAFLKAVSLVSQYIKGKNEWRRDFGQL